MVFCCLGSGFEATTNIFIKFHQILSTFRYFVHMHACFGSSPPTWGCHPPPSTGHLSLHHPLALCHCLPCHSSTTWGDSKVVSHAHVHTCAYLGQQPPISIDPYRFSWGFQCTTTPSLTLSGPYSGLLW